MIAIRRLAPYFALSVLVAGCATPAVAPQTPAAGPAAVVAARQVQSVLTVADGGAFELKPNLPTTAIPTAASLPKGEALNLEFNRQGDDPGKLNVVYYADNKPFTLTVRQGATFVVLDGDASDGTAVVQVPGAAYTYYFSTKGKPGGSLGITDPVFFAAGSQASTTAKRDWLFVGLRQTALPANYRRGETRFDFTPQSLVGGFSGRLFAASATPALPQVPPAINRLSAPDEILPAHTGVVAAETGDLNGDALKAHWTVSGGSISGNASEATITAPRPSGTYTVGLSVEDSYFTTTAPGSLTFTVPNLPPVVSLSETPEQVKRGESVALTASATDENWDDVSWRFEATGGSFTTTEGKTVTGEQPASIATTWTAPARPGTYELNAIANDGHGGAATVTRTVVVPNVAPVMGGLTMADSSDLPPRVKIERTLNMTAPATDADGDALTWTWSATAGTVSGSGASATWTAPSTPGSVTVTATVTDGFSDPVSVSTTFEVFEPQSQNASANTAGNNGNGNGNSGNGNNSGSGNSQVHDDNGNGNDPGKVDSSNPGNGKKN
ncbi:MAG TPA: hypothetical protein V6D05_09260 [Stenomitos sp.]